MNASDIALLLTIVVTGSGLIAGVFVMSKTRGTKDSVDLFRTTNQELRESYTFLTMEKERSESEFNLKLLAQDEQCKREIAELRGQIQVLRADLVTSMAKDIASTTAEAVLRALERRGPQ